MRHFTNLEKKICNYIKENGTCGCNLSNNEVVKSLFDKQTNLLILNEYSAYFFSNNQSAHTDKLSNLFSILATFDYLRKNGLIYCVPNEQKNLLFYDNSVGQCAISNSQTFTYNNLTIDIENIAITDAKLHKSLNGYKFTENTSKQIYDCFTDSIYCTQSLIELSKSGFEPIEIKSLKTQRNLSIVGAVVSIIIAICSCAWNIYMTHYNNEHSVTEMKENQFNVVVSAINENTLEIKQLDHDFKVYLQDNIKQDSVIGNSKKKDKKTTIKKTPPDKESHRQAPLIKKNSSSKTL